MKAVKEYVKPFPGYEDLHPNPERRLGALFNPHFCGANKYRMTDERRYIQVRLGWASLMRLDTAEAISLLNSLKGVEPGGVIRFRPGTAHHSRSIGKLTAEELTQLAGDLTRAIHEAKGKGL